MKVPILKTKKRRKKNAQLILIDAMLKALRELLTTTEDENALKEINANIKKLVDTRTIHSPTG